MSQTDLANGLGLTFQQVQKYEKGSNRIGSSRMVQIAGILQVNPDFFFEGAMEQPQQDWPSPSYMTDFVATSYGVALIRAFQRLPKRQLRRRIVDLVEEIADNQ